MSSAGLSPANFAGQLGALIQPFAPTLPIVTVGGHVAFADSAKTSLLVSSEPLHPIIAPTRQSLGIGTKERIDRIADATAPFLFGDKLLRPPHRYRAKNLDLGAPHLQGIGHARDMIDHAVDWIESERPTDDLVRHWVSTLDVGEGREKSPLARASVLMMAGAYLASCEWSYEYQTPELPAGDAFAKAAEAFLDAAQRTDSPDLAAAAAAVYEMAANCVDNLKFQIWPYSKLSEELAEKAAYYHDKASEFWTYALYQHKEIHGMPLPVMFIERGIMQAVRSDNKSALREFADIMAQNSAFAGKRLDVARHRLRAAYYEATRGADEPGHVMWRLVVVKNLQAAKVILDDTGKYWAIAQGLRTFINSALNFSWEMGVDERRGPLDMVVSNAFAP